MKIYLLIIGMLLFSACTLQSGISTDRIYGYDKGIVWNHLYLTNDHTTTYCFEDYQLQQIKDAYELNKTVKIEYERYVIKGFWCQAQQNQEAVVVTKIDN